MPLPAYIICSRSAVEDADNHDISYFHTIENINITKSDPLVSGRAASLLKIRATAVWLRETGQDSPENDYEFQFFVRMPGVEEDKLVGQGVFSFQKPVERLVAFGMIERFAAPGVMRILSRVRRAGADDWLEQSYPIVLTAVDDV